jgi:diguanylate cyclase (GGDEF)-like protein
MTQTSNYGLLGGNMAAKTDDNRQSRKGLFSRREKPKDETANNSDIPDAAVSSLVKLLNTAINVNFSPFTIGAEFDEFLKRTLGVVRYSLKMEEDCIDPLLLESNVIPQKLLTGVGPHNVTCPMATGKILAVRSTSPGTLCSPCGVDCDLGDAMIRFPVKLNDTVCGTFTLCLGNEPAEFENTDFHSAICRMIAGAVETALFRESNRLLEITDSLTRAHNYRFFMKTLEQELERSRRYDHPFSLILADISHLKNFNTRYGVEIGDSILKEIALILRKSVRTTDTVARYSGGKFALILTETNQDGAEKVCEKIQKTVGDFFMPHPDQNHELKVAVNTGAASFPEDAVLMSRLILSAENNLQRKKSGIIYPDSDPPGGNGI